MDFHYPDILMTKFVYEDKCCTSGLGCSLNRALFGCQLLDYIVNSTYCLCGLYSSECAVLLSISVKHFMFAAGDAGT